MSQLFRLQLATHTISTSAQQLGVTPSQLRDIQVTVSAVIVKQPEPCLQLSYDIQLPHTKLATQLHWARWTPEAVHFTDYLWQQTCLECFIAPSKGTGYIEINASPTGNYALYRFSDYRTPSTLPPAPLLLADDSARAHICWTDEACATYNSSIYAYNQLSPMRRQPIYSKALSACLFTRHYRYQRQFSVPLAQLPMDLFATPMPNNSKIGWLHPCVILWFGEVDLYFAPVHAAPPDFHQRRYWSSFFG